MDYRIPSDWRCETRDEKLAALRDFFNTNLQTHDGGLVQNSYKYLFLIGEECTGKMTLLEKVAKEVYGENWTSKVYVRKDEGQKYPYKLHAHKVESSVKVIYVTTSPTHWNRWVELYPTIKAMEFHGADVSEIPHSPYWLIDYSRMSQRRNVSDEIIRANLRTIVEDLQSEGLITEERAQRLHQTLRETLVNANQRWFSDFSGSQVTNS